MIEDRSLDPVPNCCYEKERFVWLAKSVST
jgi:hypothetical protein